MQIQNALIGSAIAVGGYFLFKDQFIATEKTETPMTKVGNSLIPTAKVNAEAQAMTFRDGSTVTPTMAVDRMESTMFQISQAQQSAEKLSQQKGDIQSRIAQRVLANGSYSGSVNDGTTRLTRVRADGKISIYDQNGAFYGYETGEIADAYAKSFNPNNIATKTPSTSIKSSSSSSSSSFAPTKTVSMTNRSSDAKKALSGLKVSSKGKWTASS